MNKLLKIGLQLAVAASMASCSELDSDDAAELLDIDVVAQQFKAGAINLGSVAARQERLDACQLAIKQVNDAGGVLGKEFNSVGLIATSTAESTELVQEMVDAGIQALEVQFSSRALAAAELTVPADRVLFASTGQSNSITDIVDNDLVYRFQPRTDTISIALAELAFAQGGTKVAVIVNDDDDFSSDISDDFLAAFVALGGELAVNIVLPVEKSSGFDAEIAMLASSDADVVLNNMQNAASAANFYNEALDIDFSQYVNLTGSFSGVSQFTDNLVNPSKINGLQGVQSPRGLQTDANVQFYQDTYLEQFDILPGGFTNGVYDACHVAGLAIERAGRENNTDDPTGIMIRDSLRAVMNPPGEIVGATTLSSALDILRSGSEIDFNGTYAHEWDDKGDLIGDLTFDISILDGTAEEWITTEQFIITVESND